MEAWLRILWLKTELLHPVDKGGRIRTYQMLRELKREHHVTYLTLDDGTAAPDAAELAAEYCDELVRVPFRRTANFSLRFWVELARSVLSPLPYTISRYRSAAFRNAVERLTAAGEFDIVVCDFLTPATNVPASLPCAAILFQHNVEAAIWRRHYEVARGPLRRGFLWLEWRRVRRFEQQACRRFDHVITVSAEDRATTLIEYGVAASDVPTGVDTAYFRAAAGARRRPHHLVFTGSMDWLPNVDGVKYFVDEILPLVSAKVPDVTLTIVGREPGPDIRALASRAGISVTGRVPDVRPYIDEAAAFIVPLRIGGGTRLKIYEAMAMECPVISTSLGAEGLPLTDGTEILLADTPRSFADAVVRVLTNASLGAELGQRAASVVRTRFGWDRAAHEFVRLIEQHAGIAIEAPANGGPAATLSADG
jgi:polysaccharide biosynthesis protein PslH